MNVNILSVVLFVGGFVLVYAGVKDVDPRDVIKQALRGKDPGDLAPMSGAGRDEDNVILLPNTKGNPKGKAAKGNTDNPDPRDQDFTPGNGEEVNV